MNAISDMFNRGGPMMYALLALSLILYTRIFHVLLALRRRRRELQGAAGSLTPPALRRNQAEVREYFGAQRIVLGSLIAAAPLLGLLGTVNGMMRTFASLGESAGQKSMEGLAGGISEVLVSTESGLAVAIPALLLVYAGHRLVIRQVQHLVRLESAARTGGAT
jgi:biopolymer transport protein ExbB/TolQ